jgi:hypothetical protein
MVQQKNVAHALVERLRTVGKAIEAATRSADNAEADARCHRETVARLRPEADELLDALEVLGVGAAEVSLYREWLGKGALIGVGGLELAIHSPNWRAEAKAREAAEAVTPSTMPAAAV